MYEVTAGKKRDQNLDALRALAILLVLFYHSPLELGYCASLLKTNGGLGVQLFFVLSGFLIGGIFFREITRQDFSLLHFWSRRWLRTIPPYIALVAIWWLGNRIAGRSKTLDWSYLCFLQNYLMPLEIRDMPFTWSLCVEEHFYLVAPILLLFFHKSPARMFCFLGLALLPITFRLCGCGEYSMSHLQFDGLIYGVCIAYLQVRSPESFAVMQRWCRCVLPISLLGFVLLLLFASEMGRLVFANLIFSVWLLALVGQEPIWIARSSVTYWIAVTSFSCYLIHGYTFETARRLCGDTAWPLRFAVYCGGTVLCTALFYFVVERGSLWLRELVSPAVKARRASN